MVRNIYFLCPEREKATGGIQKIYRQVDVLNKHGYSAYVFHRLPRFHCHWFENQTPIAYPKLTPWQYLKLKLSQFSMTKRILRVLRLQSFFFDYSSIQNAIYTLDAEGKKKRLPKLSNDDLLVLPEFFTFSLGESSPVWDYPFVIFNQGAYQSFKFSGLPSGPGKIESHQFMPYGMKNHLGVITVSKDNQEYLQKIFPDLPILRITNSFDSHLFGKTEMSKKKKICFNTSKNQNDLLQILNILKLKDTFKDWTLVPIQNMSQREVAKELRESLLFMNFCYQEGFSLPPLEAMACGCVVVGYHGQAAKEFLHEPFAFPIESGNVMQYVETLEQIAKQYEANPKNILQIGESASNYVSKAYNSEIEERDICDAWKELLKL